MHGVPIIGTSTSCPDCIKLYFANKQNQSQEAQQTKSFMGFKENIKASLSIDQYGPYSPIDVTFGSLLCWKGISLAQESVFSLGTMGFLEIMRSIGHERDDIISDPYNLFFKVKTHDVCKCASMFLQYTFGPLGSEKREVAQIQYLNSLIKSYETTVLCIAEGALEFHPALPAIQQVLSDAFPQHCEASS
jgi:hypothetical protein